MCAQICGTSTNTCHLHTQIYVLIFTIHLTNYYYYCYFRYRVISSKSHDNESDVDEICLDHVLPLICAFIFVKRWWANILWIQCIMCVCVDTVNPELKTNSRSWSTFQQASELAHTSDIFILLFKITNMRHKGTHRHCTEYHLDDESFEEKEFLRFTQSVHEWFKRSCRIPVPFSSMYRSNPSHHVTQFEQV